MKRTSLQSEIVLGASAFWVLGMMIGCAADPLKAQASTSRIPPPQMAEENNENQTERLDIIKIEKQDSNRAAYALKSSDKPSELDGSFVNREMSQFRKNFVRTRPSREKTASQLDYESRAFAIEDKRAADAAIARSTIAKVKEDTHKLHLTLSGSVFFSSNQSSLSPHAQHRLKQIVNMLLTDRSRHLTIEGHTDSRGSNSNNMRLSQRRSESVRDYFIKNEYDAKLIDAEGMGEGHPVATNGNPEGRANNRRVEIIVERTSITSNGIFSNR